MRKLSLNHTRSAKTLTLIQSYLPKKKRNSSWKSSEKLLCGIMGFVAGAQCLDDFDTKIGLEGLRTDLGFYIESKSIVQFSFRVRLFSKRSNSLTKWQKPLPKVVTSNSTFPCGSPWAA